AHHRDELIARVDHVEGNQPAHDGGSNQDVDVEVQQEGDKREKFDHCSVPPPFAAAKPKFADLLQQGPANVGIGRLARLTCTFPPPGRQARAVAISRLPRCSVASLDTPPGGTINALHSRVSATNLTLCCISAGP